MAAAHLSQAAASSRRSPRITEADTRSAEATQRQRVAEKPWAPTDTEELLHAIATQDYGVSDDRSSKLATPAIKAYNKVADSYHQTLQKKGQPLHEGFTIVKVRAAPREMQSRDLTTSRDHGRSRGLPSGDAIS